MSNPIIFSESKSVGKTGMVRIFLHKLDLPYYPAHYVVRLSWWANEAGPTDEQSYLHQFTGDAAAIRFTIKLFDDYCARMELTQ